MNAEYFEFIGSGGAVVPAMLWEPAEVKAVVQIAHGTTEHMGRYEKFAAVMAPYGIAVAGLDIRGHGRNPGDPKVAAMQPGQWQAAAEDVQLFRGFLAEKYPDVPRFLLGFSLGSFLVRDVLKENSAEGLAGAILVGTGHQPGWLLDMMRSVVNGQIQKFGFDQPSALVRKLSFGMYNDKFKPNRTDVDWLSTDEAAVDAYLADPLVRRNTAAGLFWELLGSMRRHCGPKEYDSWDKNLPILLISGGEDPVGNAGKGVAAVYQRMKKSGMQDVTMHLIPGARHAILQGGAEGAEETIAGWVTRHG